MSKSYQRKKQVRAGWQKKQRDGFMNDVDGTWKTLPSFKESSMRRDYGPKR